ncbi:MAG: flavodoxin domain-containing protein [Candidatus Kariarchaeaceae archaeon]|jgi:menaquinone-dependent protoporphyrinogen IX oxidase
MILENKKKIIIVYGSRYNSSSEISSKICRVLEDRGLSVKIIDILKNKGFLIKETVGNDNYNGIIVGSGIRIGKWVNEIITFIKHNREFIEHPRVILGVFVSSLLASVPTEYESSKKEFLTSKLEELHIQPDISEIFGGVFDLTKNTQVNWYERMMVKRVLRQKKYQDTILPTFEDGVRNDFRDWNQIMKFANDFHDLL